MQLTMSEARQILETRGFTIKTTGPDDMNPDIYYQGEWMGYLYEFHAYIHKSIPSLGIDDETEEVHFSDSDADMHLMRILEGLTSHQTISEEQMRRVRAENVRKYFKERKDAETMLSQTTYDYEKLIKQLNKRSTEENLQCC